MVRPTLVPEESDFFGSRKTTLIFVFISERYCWFNLQKGVSKMKGWLVIGACVLGIVAFVGILYVLGTAF